jgi:Ran-binding protein 9/10
VTDGLEIRAAILEGDIDKALKYTNAYFSQVLQDNPHILFKLRCRKFLEMLCKCSDISAAATGRAKRSEQVFGQEEEEEEEDMEVDDQDGYSDGEGMDTEETTTNDTARFHELLTEAVQYGQQLRMDYPSDDNAGDKQYLDDIFSLVAYPDPRSSVHGHHLDASGRVAVADDLNSAILGISSSPFASRMKIREN